MIGLIGKKLGHSYSKGIHQQLGNTEYQMIEVNEEKLEELFLTKKIRACNVTIPYKQTVLKYLDEMDDKKELTGLEGDLKSGILYLTKEEIKEMKQLIEKFQNNHAEPTEDTIPWEYALIAYPKKEVK